MTSATESAVSFKEASPFFFFFFFLSGSSDAGVSAVGAGVGVAGVSAAGVGAAGSADSSYEKNDIRHSSQMQKAYDELRGIGEYRD